MRYILAAISLILMNAAFGQQKQRIVVYVDSLKATASFVNGNPDQNDLVFYNKQHLANSVTLVPGQNSPDLFRLIFDAASIAQDSTVLHFTSTGVVATYPDATQQISFPLAIIIKNAAGNPLTTAPLAVNLVTTPSNATVTNNANNTGLNGVVTVYPQPTKSPVYDALQLATLPPNTTTYILNYYKFKGFDGNQFLQGETSLSPHLSSDFLGGFTGSVLSSIGGLDVTSIADGLAKFLVKRTKEELGLAFFDKFKQVLDDPAYADLKTLFPQTYSLLHSIDQDIYDYQRYIQNLREGFKADIAALYTNLPGIIDNHKAFFDAHQEWAAALRSACYIAAELGNQAHPGDIIANYPVTYLDNASKNIKGSVQAIQLISESLHDTATAANADYWISIGKIRELVNNQKALRIYLGLVYQLAKYRYDSVQFTHTDLLTILNSAAAVYDNNINTYNAYKRFVLGFGDKTDAIRGLLQQQTAALSDSAKIALYAKYFTATVGILDYTTQALDLPYANKLIKTDTLKATLKKYFTVSYAAANLLTDINSRNYAGAINNTVKIYRLVATTEDTVSMPSLSNPHMETAQSKLVYYGSFMAAVATAKSSDEVESVIESFALPTGSSRVKRNTKFNVSLNAYTGLFIGSEKISGVDDKFKVNSYGVTAPVGFAVSWGGNCKKVKNHSSTSIFLSLIDIGAVTAFRFKDDKTESVPTITLADIVSPGLFFSYGISGTPISVNLGYQSGPLLRNVSPSINDYSKSYGRISLSFCVDIPLLNLYTKNW